MNVPWENTVYMHPTSAGNKHIPSGGASGQILRWGSDGTAVWGADNDTKYTSMVGATTSAAGVTGLVPQPPAGAANRYLRSDGTWQVPPDTNTVYAHPTSSGNKHIPAGGSSGQILRWSADGTAQWGSDSNTWRGIQNSLTSDSTTDSLAAAQGKVLKSLIDDTLLWKNALDADEYTVSRGSTRTFYLPTGKTIYEMLLVFGLKGSSASGANTNNCTTYIIPLLKVFSSPIRSYSFPVFNDTGSLKAIAIVTYKHTSNPYVSIMSGELTGSSGGSSIAVSIYFR